MLDVIFYRQSFRLFPCGDSERVFFNGGGFGAARPIRVRVRLESQLLQDIAKAVVFLLGRFCCHSESLALDRNAAAHSCRALADSPTPIAASINAPCLSEAVSNVEWERSGNLCRVRAQHQGRETPCHQTISSQDEVVMTPTHAPYSFLAHLEAVSTMMATPKNMPDATRPRISEPCMPDASMRGLPRLFSKTNVPMSAITNAKNQLLFLISYCGRNAGSVSPKSEII